MKFLALFSIAGTLVLAACGCNGGDEGKQMTTDQSKQQMQKQLDNPNMPPEAKAAAARMQGQGADYSKQYGSAQPKTK